MARLNILEFVTDDNAVSSVIGVILMVAVTVILAAAVSVFVLDLGTGQATDTTPQAKFDVTWSDEGGNDVVTIEHIGGDTLNTKEINVTLGNSVVWTHAGGATGSLSIHDSQNWSADEITADDVLALEGSMSDGTSMKIVWTRGDKSQFLLETEVE